MGHVPGMLVINDKLNVISGSDSDNHLIWNQEKHEFDTIFTFPSFGDGVYGHGVVHVKRLNLIYLFGGYDYGHGSWNFDIWKCEIDKEYKWTKLKIEMNHSFYTKGYILTSDEKYIIMFRSGTIIRLFDVDKEIFCKDIEIDNGEFVSFAVLSGNEKDEMIVNGYIREIGKELDVMIPHELNGLFEKYYRLEMIYGVNHTKSFYQISVDSVLSASE